MNSSRKICPECGHKMRRLYVKQNFRIRTEEIEKRKIPILKKKKVVVSKNKTKWRKIGWWCPICNHVIINPEH